MNGTRQEGHDFSTVLADSDDRYIFRHILDLPAKSPLDPNVMAQPTVRGPVENLPIPYSSEAHLPLGDGRAVDRKDPSFGNWRGRGRTTLQLRFPSVGAKDAAEDRANDHTCGKADRNTRQFVLHVICQ